MAHLSAIFIIEGAQNTGVRQQILKLADCETECVKCEGFCCKSTFPMLRNKEVITIAKVLKLEVKEFLGTYCATNPATGHYPSLKKPCPLLDNNNRCNVYKVRPEVCKEFPFSDGIFEYGPCQIANNIIKKMMKTDMWKNKIFDLNKEENMQLLIKEIGLKGAEDRKAVYNKWLTLGDKIVDTKFWQHRSFIINEFETGGEKSEEIYEYGLDENWEHLRLGLWRGEDLRELLKIMRGI